MIKTLKSFVYVVTVLAAFDSTLSSAQQVGPNVAPPQEIAPQVGMPIQSVDPSVRSNIADQKPNQTAEQEAALPQIRRSATASKWGPTRNAPASAHSVPGRTSNRTLQAVRVQADSERLVSIRQWHVADSWRGKGVKNPRNFTIQVAPFPDRSSSANLRLFGQESGARSAQVASPADEPPSAFINTRLLELKSHTLFAGGKSPLAAGLYAAPMQRNKRHHPAARKHNEKRLTRESRTFGTHRQAVEYGEIPRHRP